MSCLVPGPLAGQAGEGPLQSCGGEHRPEELSWHPDLLRTPLFLSPQPTVTSFYKT